MEEDDHEWFWALDLDALITNGDAKATDLLDDKYDLVVTRDCNWFNAGSFFIKNSEWSKNFLRQGTVVDIVLNVTNPSPDFFREQAAIMNVKDANPGYDSHFKWIPQKQMNAYSDYPGICNKAHEKDHPVWESGDLVLHFPGHSSASWFHDFLKEWNAKVIGLDDGVRTKPVQTPQTDEMARKTI
jgi:mannan polymerase II complex MNN10 subunit